VVVTDPDGNANEIQLRKVKQKAPVARDDFWGFGRAAEGGAAPAEGRRAARRGGGEGGGGGGGMFNWLFR
jgi:hypothetical protein